MKRETLRSLWCLVLAAAMSWGAGAQEAGRDPAAGEAMAGGTTIVDLEHPVTATGELTVWRAYSSQGGRVMLKVWRPEGDRLVLVGTSALETVPPGAVAVFRCSIPVARNDLIGCYCPDATCVDRFADGLVETGAGDLGTVESSQLATGLGEPALAAAGSPVAGIPTPVGTDLVLPVAARTPGLEGTHWTTALEIFNTGDQAATVALFFDRSGEDNTSPAAAAQIEVPARGTVVLEDLLLDAFGLEQDVGAVDLVASQPVTAHARIANTVQGGGTYGQLVPAVPAEWAAGPVPEGIDPGVSVLSMFEVRDDEEWRTNVGVVNVSGVAADLVVTAMLPGSAAGVSRTLHLPPYSHLQVNHVLQWLGVADPQRPVRITVSPAVGSAARFLAYASRVDNRTGDAVFLLGHGEPAL